jgi:hypothetical protein
MTPGACRSFLTRNGWGIAMSVALVLGSTACGESTVAAPTQVVETTSAPLESTPVPLESTPVPLESTPVPLESTPVPLESTPVPLESMPFPVERTLPPVESTPFPVERPPGPVESSPVPVETTLGAVSPSGECPASGFTIGLGGTDAAMGLRVVGVVLTNCSSERRKVKGYPVIKLFDKDRNLLPIKVKPGAVPMADPDPGPKSLALAPGKTAVAVLSWRNTVLADGTDPVTGEFALLAVNSTERAHIEALHLDAGTTGRVAVTAWQKSNTR